MENQTKVLSADAVGGLEPMYIQDGVKVINICHLIDFLFGERSWNSGPSYKEQGVIIMKWAEEHGAHYYAACKEDFFIWNGVWEAQKKGKTVVIVENMS